MNLFELVKFSVTVRQAAEKYGIQANRNGMTRCPFHDDRTPSLKLNDTYYYCFGCGAKGDVIDFVAKLFGLSALEAVKKLAADFGLDPNTPPAAIVVAAPRRTPETCDKWFYCQRVLLDYLELLEDWQLRYAPTTPDEPQDERFIEALRMHGWITHLLDHMEAVSADKRTEEVKKLMANDLIAEFDRRVQRRRKELNDADKLSAA